ncbi:secreted RxLR effector protein 161-like [Solanum lycopersicum]|uniref:secreted RxLR effector protein 161-like n=1 Tax=Solanum lycopersicum TaxID=4081 RepID=UPI00374A7EB2
MDCRSVAIPLAANEKFRKDNGEKKVNISLFRSLIGNSCARTKPSAFGAAKCVLRFLQGTMDYGMYKFDGNLNLIGYSDSDWAGSIDDMKSTSGYAFLFGSNICSCLSKKQSVVAQSTGEAEYVSASKAT